MQQHQTNMALLSSMAPKPKRNAPILFRWLELESKVHKDDEAIKLFLNTRNISTVKSSHHITASNPNEFKGRINFPNGANDSR